VAGATSIRHAGLGGFAAWARAKRQRGVPRAGGGDVRAWGLERTDRQVQVPCNVASFWTFATLLGAASELWLVSVSPGSAPSTLMYRRSMELEING
jgi:hypothetical protein